MEAKWREKFRLPSLALHKGTKMQRILHYSLYKLAILAALWKVNTSTIVLEFNYVPRRVDILVICTAFTKQMITYFTRFFHFLKTIVLAQTNKGNFFKNRCIFYQFKLQRTMQYPNCFLKWGNDFTKPCKQVATSVQLSLSEFLSQKKAAKSSSPWCLFQLQ